METLFSFGTWEGYPFQRGYIIINAENRQAAVAEFRRRYPDKSPSTLNCADIYTDEQTIKEFKENGNLGGKGCHLYVDLIRGVTFRHAEAPELKGWTWKDYYDGSGHLESPDGKEYFGYDISSQEYKKLNGNPFNEFKAFAEKSMVEYNALSVEMDEAQKEWDRMNKHLENGGDIADFDPDHIGDVTEGYTLSDEAFLTSELYGDKYDFDTQTSLDIGKIERAFTKDDVVDILKSISEETDKGSGFVVGTVTKSLVKHIIDKKIHEVVGEVEAPINKDAKDNRQHNKSPHRDKRELSR